MLTYLQISNFAVIHKVGLELDAGLAVLTGETGAGKSILVDALGLALGDRADSSVVRQGAKTAEIVAGFDVSRNDKARDWLERQAIDCEEELVLRRSISAEGRSRAFVNDTSVSLQSLRNLAEHLVEIHGQHAHQTLGRQATQRDLLDAVGKHKPVIDRTAQHYAAWRAARDELESLQAAADERADRLDLLRYQYAELDAFGPQPGEYESLADELQRLRNVDRLGQGAQAALVAIYEAEQGAAQSLVANASTDITELAGLDAGLRDTAALLEQAEIQIREAADELRNYLATLEIDPQRLSHVEERIAGYRDLARKHRCEAEVLDEQMAGLSAQLEGLEHADERVAELRDRAERCERDYLKSARNLGVKRRKVAARLNDGVSAWMSKLGMAGGRLDVRVVEREDGNYSESGLDNVEFLVSTNPGHPPQPIAKIASGGELSRIALAIRVVAAQATVIPTLVFDEVDTGVGGGVAEIVGRCLQQLGGDRQVLCVTHLPQVASQADMHLRVSKVTDGKTTRTSIHRLDENETVEELARMLGGVEITDTTRRHAREMMNKARARA
jgi:DNA repair protein RecN (Recombination protein N)